MTKRASARATSPRGRETLNKKEATKSKGETRKPREWEYNLRKLPHEHRA
jgi:hypothetical protein